MSLTYMCEVMKSRLWEMSYLLGTQYRTNKSVSRRVSQYGESLCYTDRLEFFISCLFKISLWISHTFIDVTREEDDSCFGK